MTLQDSCQNHSVGEDRTWWTETSHTGCAVLGPDSENPEPEVRWDLVERVRREIAEGTYETEEKWEIAITRLCERLEGGSE